MGEIPEASKKGCFVRFPMGLCGVVCSSGLAKNGKRLKMQRRIKAPLLLPPTIVSRRKELWII